eukprot:COSAG02_NODE_3178_length_7221_cov_1.761163_2_plen_51_part_00
MIGVGAWLAGGRARGWHIVYITSERMRRRREARDPRALARVGRGLRVANR